MRLTQILLVAVAVMMFATRIFGPSSLHRFDQPRTATYTADMVLNGCWLLPRDILGYPATKPLLVNWLAAPFVKMGFWTEWALKVPMLLGSLATLAMTAWMARALLSQALPADEKQARLVANGAALAGMAWLANAAGINVIYLCRPDPLLLAFLTLGWILGTRILDPSQPNNWKIVLAFWITVGLAALTKGPPALLPVFYLPLAARLIHSRWSLMQRTGWWWGLPLALAMFAAWIVPVAIFYPQHFRETLIGREVLAPLAGMGSRFGNHRITNDGPLGLLTTFPKNPIWFLERFAPWSLLAIASAAVIGPRQWFRHPLAPAVLWILLTFGFFSIMVHKTADYQMAAYPAAAILAAYFCVSVLPRFKIQPQCVAWIGFFCAVGFCVNWIFFSEPAVDPVGDNMWRFAKATLGITGKDRIVCVNTGYNPVQFFLHQHQPDPPTAAELDAARWVVMPQNPAFPAELISGKIAAGANKTRPPLALYRGEVARELLKATRDTF